MSKPIINMNNKVVHGLRNIAKQPELIAILLEKMNQKMPTSPQRSKNYKR